MADWGVSFSAPMVQALLDGRKTQTRRLAWKAERPTRLPSRLAAVQPGDTLWVREEWALTGEWAAARPSELSRFNNPGDMTRHHRAYRASADGYDDAVQHWRQPRHMPRWASRLTLLVTDVRVQQLRDITEADAMAEGVEPVLVPPDGGSCPHVFGFLNLWDQLHGPGGWEANPEVVALSFTVHHGNIDAMGATHG